MTITLRPGTHDDAEACGRIAYDAFRTVTVQHNFRPDFPTVESAIGYISSLLTKKDYYSVIAEQDGRIIGSNFLNEEDEIAGVGPVSVAPISQNHAVGQMLMSDVMDRAQQIDAPSVRLMQAGFHIRSLALYAKFGFETKACFAIMSGNPIRRRMPGYDVRLATTDDLDQCNRLHETLNGFSRSNALRAAVDRQIARVVERNGEIRGYASSLTGLGHAVGETTQDLVAIISEAEDLPGMLVPTGNNELFLWCLKMGMRVSVTHNLMVTGSYRTPGGASMPSMFY